MAGRLELHEVLCTILGSRNVYFQPPSSLNMSYPCIRYSRGVPDTKFADNSLYVNKERYTVIVIDKDPDSLIPGKVAQLPFCKKTTQTYTKDNLNHDVYSLYY